MKETPLAHLERTHDMEAVAAIMRHPSCWPSVSDDYTPEDWEPLDHPQMVWLLAVSGEQPAGVTQIYPSDTSGAMAVLHIAMLPGFRGKVAAETVRATFQWAWDNTGFEKLVAMIPRENLQARSLVNGCGMTKQGMLHRAFRRGGKLQDLAVYGIELDVATQNPWEGT